MNYVNLIYNQVLVENKEIVSEPVARRCSVRKVFLDSQENTCARVSF